MIGTLRRLSAGPGLTEKPYPWFIRQKLSRISSEKWPLVISVKTAQLNLATLLAYLEFVPDDFLTRGIFFTSREYVFSKRHKTLLIINKKYFPALFNIVFLHKDHEERKITAINAV